MIAVAILLLQQHPSFPEVGSNTSGGSLDQSGMQTPNLALFPSNNDRDSDDLKAVLKMVQKKQLMQNGAAQ